MHIAALIGGLRQSFAQRRPEAGVIVGDDKLDAVQTARLQSQQEIPPARSALAIGELDRHHLTPAVPVDADRDQHRLADNHAGLAHPLVARIQDQIEEAEKLWPHSSSVIALTLRVETPCTYISANAATSARSERWYRSNNSVEKRPARSCGTRSSSLPTRVISVRP